MYDYPPWSMKRKLREPKGKQIVMERELFALVTMGGSLDFDPPPPWDAVYEDYYVYAWVYPENTESHYITLPSPSLYRTWRGMQKVPVVSHELYDYLHVEVCRSMVDYETGPSCGKVLVGRTRVKLPKIGANICGKYELHRPDPEGAGMLVAGEISLRIEVGYSRE